MICSITPSGRHLGQRGEQRLVAVAGDVVVDLFGIDVAGVFEHHAHLLVEVLAQVALQTHHRLAAQAIGNGLGIAGFHVLIECLVGIDANQRAGGAGSHAPSAANECAFA